MMRSIGYAVGALALAIGLSACGPLTEESKRGSFDDGDLTAAVQKSLADDDGTAFSEVVVQISSGTVYLTGSVPDAGAKERAGNLARDVAGVRHVVNNLGVGDAAEADAS